MPAAARFTDRRTVVAGETTIRARRTVIATGAVLDPPELAGLDAVGYLTAASAFELADKPAHLLVLGANSRALELAQAYNRLGIATTVLDEKPALAGEDPELAAIVLDRLRAEGIRIRDNAKIASVVRFGSGIRIALVEAEGEVAIDGSHLLVETGRSPRIDGLGLDAAGIMHDRTGITVDRLLKTTNRRVYAIGDAIAGPALASRAEYEADYVLRAILYRLPFHEKAWLVPAVTFTDPALARVGLSEEEARLRQRDIRVLRYPFVENDLAQAERLASGRDQGDHQPDRARARGRHRRPRRRRTGGALVAGGGGKPQYRRSGTLGAALSEPFGDLEACSACLLWTRFDAGLATTHH